MQKSLKATRLLPLMALTFGLTASAMTSDQNRKVVFPPTVETRPGNFPGPGDLFVGTWYQPIDRSPQQIVADIAIMKGAGFNVVRMGDLSWDSFEPSDGKFQFEWFDKILDQMHEAGIRVVLDIPGSPAPIWLHRHYPGVDIVSQEGNRVPIVGTKKGLLSRKVFVGTLILPAKGADFLE